MPSCVLIRKEINKQGMRAIGNVLFPPSCIHGWRFFLLFFFAPFHRLTPPRLPTKRRGAFILGEEEKNNNSSIVDTSKPYMRAAMRSLTMASIVPLPPPPDMFMVQESLSFSFST